MPGTLFGLLAMDISSGCSSSTFLLRLPKMLRGYVPKWKSNFFLDPGDSELSDRLRSLMLLLLDGDCRRERKLRNENRRKLDCGDDCSSESRKSGSDGSLDGGADFLVPCRRKLNLFFLGCFCTLGFDCLAGMLAPGSLWRLALRLVRGEQSVYSLEICSLKLLNRRRSFSACSCILWGRFRVSPAEWLLLRWSSVSAGETLRVSVNSYSCLVLAVTELLVGDGERKYLSSSRSCSSSAVISSDGSSESESLSPFSASSYSLLGGGTRR